MPHLVDVAILGASGEPTGGVIVRPAHLAPEWLYSITIAFSVTLSTMMFYFAYRYVPRRRPRVFAALVGGLLTAVLWLGRVGWAGSS